MIESVEFFFKPLVMLGRLLLWLVWELCIEVVAWAIGWVVCKTITFGKWPNAKFNERENLDWFEAAIVFTAGFATIFMLVYFVAA